MIILRISCGGDHGDEWIQRPRDGDGDDDEDFCYAVYADWNSQLTFRQAEKNCSAQVHIMKNIIFYYIFLNPFYIGENTSLYCGTEWGGGGGHEPFIISWGHELGKGGF